MTTILRYKKLRTRFLLQQSNENLMSAWKYLSVKTRIMQKPKSVNWFTLPISWLVSIWHAFLLNGISQQTIKTFRYKRNLLLCPKKSINNEGDRHLWKSHFTPYSCISPDMSLLQGWQNGFWRGTMEYRKVLSVTMVDPQERFLNSRQKSSKRSGGPCPLQPPSPVSPALYCYISYEISFCFKVIIFFSMRWKLILKGFVRLWIFQETESNL